MEVTLESPLGEEQGSRRSIYSGHPVETAGPRGQNAFQHSAKGMGASGRQEKT